MNEYENHVGTLKAFSSTHTFCLSPAKIFTLDMRKLMAPIESEEKYLFALFTFDYKYFNFRKIVLQLNQQIPYKMASPQLDRE